MNIQKPHADPVEASGSAMVWNILAAEPIDLRSTGYTVIFPCVPVLGSRIVHRTNSFLTLVDATPYTRKCGQQSAILIWEDETGRRATSGLKSKSVRWHDAIPDDEINLEQVSKPKTKRTFHNSPTPNRITSLIEKLLRSRAHPFDLPIVSLEEVQEAVAARPDGGWVTTQELGVKIKKMGGVNLGRIPVGGGERIRVWALENGKHYTQMRRTQVGTMFLSKERP